MNASLHRAFRLITFGAFALVLIGTLSKTSGQEKSSTYAITHAKIFTLAGWPVEAGTIVIRDGKISGVGATVEIPAGAQTIDGKACRYTQACSIRSRRWA